MDEILKKFKEDLTAKGNVILTEFFKSDLLPLVLILLGDKDAKPEALKKYVLGLKSKYGLLGVIILKDVFKVALMATLKKQVEMSPNKIDDLIYSQVEEALGKSLDAMLAHMEEVLKNGII